MSRNASGVYSLPSGNPVLADTLIEADNWANPTMEDIGAEMTDSLSRSGKGGMTAELRIVDGTESLPGWAFIGETGSGAYRTGPSDWSLAVNGTQAIQLTESAGATTVTFTGATNLGSTLTIDVGDTANNALHLISDRADLTTVGPTMLFQRTNTPGIDDAQIGQIAWQANNASGANQNMVRLRAIMHDATAATLTSGFAFATKAGADLLVNHFNFVGDFFGIGTEDPKGKLHIHSGVSGAVAPNGMNDLIVEGADQTGISILFPDGETGNLNFGTPADSLAATLAFEQLTNLFTLRTRSAGGQVRIASADNAEAIRVTSLQRIGIGRTDPQQLVHLQGVNPVLRLNETGEAGSYTDLKHTGNGFGAITIVHDVGQAVLDIDPTPSDNVSASDIRINRGTTTTGSVSVIFYRGDGTATIDHALESGDTASSYMIAGATARMGFGVTAPLTKVHIKTALADVLYLESTNDGSGLGPGLILHRNSVSPATLDFGAEIRFTHEDDASAAFSAIKIFSQITDVAAATRSARLYFQTTVSNALQTRMNLAQGLWMEGATGGDQGNSTINAVQFFANGTAGVSGSGTNVTVVGGIVTAVS